MISLKFCYNPTPFNNTIQRVNSGGYPQKFSNIFRISQSDELFFALKYIIIQGETLFFYFFLMDKGFPFFPGSSSEVTHSSVLLLHMKYAQSKGQPDFFRIYIAVNFSTVCLGTLIAGCVNGWSAPALVKLQSGDFVFNITSAEGSALALYSEIGHFLVPIPCGILADIIGRKPLFLMTSVAALIGWGFISFGRTYNSKNFAICI